MTACWTEVFLAAAPPSVWEEPAGGATGLFSPSNSSFLLISFALIFLPSVSFSSSYALVFCPLSVLGTFFCPQPSPSLSSAPPPLAGRLVALSSRPPVRSLSSSVLLVKRWSRRSSAAALPLTPPCCPLCWTTLCRSPRWLTPSGVRRLLFFSSSL